MLTTTSLYSCRFCHDTGVRLYTEPQGRNLIDSRYLGVCCECNRSDRFNSKRGFTRVYDPNFWVGKDSKVFIRIEGVDRLLSEFLRDCETSS